MIPGRTWHSSPGRTVRGIIPALSDYIHAAFTINQIFRYADSHAGMRQLSSRVDSVYDVLNVINHPPEGLDYYFSERIDSILPHQEIEDEKPEVLAIRDMEVKTSGNIH